MTVSGSAGIIGIIAKIPTKKIINLTIVIVIDTIYITGIENPGWATRNDCHSIARGPVVKAELFLYDLYAAAKVAQVHSRFYWQSGQEKIIAERMKEIVCKDS